MKHAKWLVVLTLVVLSGMAAAQLNGASRIVTQVPFEFVVGNKIIPAGECVVQVATMDGKSLTIRNTDTKAALFSFTSLTESKQDAAHYALVFRHYGDRYFLSGIKLKGTRIGYRLPESKAEAELRAQNIPGPEETLLAAVK